MRHILLKPAAFLLLGSLCSTAAFAQNNSRSKTITKEETVIIKKGRTDGRTVVEVKDGTVYVNGDAIITVHDADANVHKKVIIEDAGKDPRGDAFDFGFNNDDFKDMPAPNGQRKAMLGVMTDPRSNKNGAVVKDVTPGSPAEEAGLERGDVITSIDGKSIRSAEDLVAEIGSRHEAGDKVTINYERNGKERAATAKLQPAQPQMSMRSFRMNPDDMNGDMPNSFFRSFPFSAMDDASPSPKLGVSAEDRADGEGVRILDVKPNSPAENAGLKEGDVITRIGEDRISSVDELQMNLRGAKAGEKLKLEISVMGRHRLLRSPCLKL
jgi:serine protease Do